MRTVEAETRARPEYLAAFREIVGRIESSLVDAAKRTLPVRMILAGGAAVHFYTGERISRDIDAAFSQRVALPDNLEAAYRDADGAARVLYLDRQYNDTLALMHEDAAEDALPLALEGIDRSVLDVRILTPLDLAVSKISRLSDVDREDIAALARRGLVGANAVKRRADQAAAGCVGDLPRLRGSIDLACRIVADVEARERRHRSK